MYRILQDVRLRSHTVQAPARFASCSVFQMIWANGSWSSLCDRKRMPSQEAAGIDCAAQTRFHTTSYLPHARQKAMHEKTGAQPRSYLLENLVCYAAPTIYPVRDGEVAAWPVTSFQGRRTQPWSSRFSRRKRRYVSVRRGAAKTNEDCADEYN